MNLFEKLIISYACKLKGESTYITVILLFIGWKNDGNIYMWHAILWKYIIFALRNTSLFLEV